VLDESAGEDGGLLFLPDKLPNMVVSGDGAEVGSPNFMRRRAHREERRYVWVRNLR
jgi:hypothetical protein